MINKKYKILFTPLASEDLEQTYSYIFNQLFAEQAASRIFNEIQHRIMCLATQPYAGPAVLFEPWKNRGYRKLITGNYIAYYVVREELNQVIIVRILHGSRDFLNLL